MARFVHGSRTDLHVQSVTLAGHIYRDVILEQNVRLFRGAMSAEFLFMDGNARPYCASFVEECLQSEDITRDRYCKEVILPHVLRFRDAIGPDFFFMHDNTRSCRITDVQKLLGSEDMTQVDWPAISPDLNPIEHTCVGYFKEKSCCTITSYREHPTNETNTD
ncbi:transposable element Tc3 transposase [Trichonephila clavipes]|nr:transposable element Tc3 transposase [Trichonephila clavipes]